MTMKKMARGAAHGQAYKTKKAKPVMAKKSTPAGSKVSKKKR